MHGLVGARKWSVSAARTMCRGDMHFCTRHAPSLSLHSSHAAWAEVLLSPAIRTNGFAG